MAEVVCRRCGKDLPHPGPPFFCLACIDYTTGANRKRHNVRKALGVCIHHPDRKAETKTLCRECHQVKLDRYQAAKQQTATTCIRGPHPNDQPERSVLCRACTIDSARANRSERAKKWRRKWERKRRRARVAAGMCQNHGSRKAVNGSRCADCVKAHAANYLRRKARKKLCQTSGAAGSPGQTKPGTQSVAAAM